MKRVTGGKIFVIDTEHRRALHYAEDFDFQHVDMKEPFSPLDYLAAIESCEKQGAKILIVDSFSHCHEGPGGVLDMHDEEVKRLAGPNADYARRERMNFPAWGKPKKQHQKLVSSILRLGINAIFCFRAKQKILMPKKGEKDMVHLGWQPIVTDGFEYEMTVSCLLYPNADGVPIWKPEERGERHISKKYAQMAHIFPDGDVLSEDTGEALAHWAAGKRQGVQAPSAPRDPAPENQGLIDDAIGRMAHAADLGQLATVMDEIKLETAPKLNKADLLILREAAQRRTAAIKKAASGPPGDYKFARGGGHPPASEPEFDPDTGEEIPGHIGRNEETK